MKHTSTEHTAELTPRQLKSRIDKVYKAMRAHGKHPHHFYELYYLNDKLQEQQNNPPVYGWSNNGRTAPHH